MGEDKPFQKLLDKLSNSIISDIIASVIVGLVINLLPDKIKTAVFIRDIWGNSMTIPTILVCVLVFLWFAELRELVFFYKFRINRKAINRINKKIEMYMTVKSKEEAYLYIISTFVTKEEISQDLISFLWTGSKCEVSVNGAPLALRNGKNKELECVVPLGRTYKPNETISYRLDFKLLGEGDPRLCYRVKHPTRKLFLKVHFDRDLILSNVHREVTVANSDYVFDKKSFSDTQRQEYEFCPKKVLFFHNYMIKWNLEN